MKLLLKLLLVLASLAVLLICIYLLKKNSNSCNPICSGETPDCKNGVCICNTNSCAAVGKNCNSSGKCENPCNPICSGETPDCKNGVCVCNTDSCAAVGKICNSSGKCDNSCDPICSDESETPDCKNRVCVCNSNSCLKGTYCNPNGGCYALTVLVCDKTTTSTDIYRTFNPITTNLALEAVSFTTPITQISAFVYNGDYWVCNIGPQKMLLVNNDNTEVPSTIGLKLSTQDEFGIVWYKAKQLWIAAGGRDFDSGGNNRCIYWSTDGKNWIESTGDNFDVDSSTIDCNDKICLASGRGRVNLLSSTDGKVWSKITSAGQDMELKGVIWNKNCHNGIWVGYGTYSQLPFNFMYSLSPDASVWQYGSNDIFTGRDSHILDVAHNNGSIWVAVGYSDENTIAYSTTGITWVGLGKTIFTTNGRRVKWNGKYFIAVGHNNDTQVIAYSSDGKIWSSFNQSFIVDSISSSFIKDQ